MRNSAKAFFRVTAFRVTAFRLTAAASRLAAIGLRIATDNAIRWCGADGTGEAAGDAPCFSDRCRVVARDDPHVAEDNGIAVILEVNL